MLQVCAFVIGPIDSIRITTIVGCGVSGTLGGKVLRLLFLPIFTRNVTKTIPLVVTAGSALQKQPRMKFRELHWTSEIHFSNGYTLELLLNEIVSEQDQVENIADSTWIICFHLALIL